MRFGLAFFALAATGYLLIGVGFARRELVEDLSGPFLSGGHRLVYLTPGQPATKRLVSVARAS